MRDSKNTWRTSNMQTKSYTDLEQSKVLAKILPLESADMWWNYYSVTIDFGTPLIIHLDTPWVGSFNWSNKPDNIPCWSLAALLKLMPKIGAQEPMLRKLYYISEPTERYICQYSLTGMTSEYDNPVDACYEMIMKLKENNLL